MSKFYSCQSWENELRYSQSKFWTIQWTSTKYWLDASNEKWWTCHNQLENYSINQNLKKLFHSDTLLEGSVKLTSMQLVGECIAAISVHLYAIKKQENMHFCGKELSESANELLWNWIFSDLGNITRSKSVEERKTKGSERINQYSALNLNQSSLINPKKSIKS